MQKAYNDLLIFLLATTSLILLLVLFIIVIVYLYRKKQINFSQNLQALKLDFDNTLLITQLEIQEQTFENISREIHDNIGLSLTLAKLNLNTIGEQNTAQWKDLINSAIDLISRSIIELSDISKCLNADTIAEQGLINAINNEIIRITKLKKYSVVFEITGNAVFLSAQKELVIFRIIQEALNNILKHAKARNILLKLHYEKDLLHILIKDDGVGFVTGSSSKSRQQNGFGLKNMSKRANMVNGVCLVESIRDKGTSIKLFIPIENE